MAYNLVFGKNVGESVSPTKWIGLGSYQYYGTSNNYSQNPVIWADTKIGNTYTWVFQGYVITTHPYNDKLGLNNNNRVIAVINNCDSYSPPIQSYVTNPPYDGKIIYNNTLWYPDANGYLVQTVTINITFLASSSSTSYGFMVNCPDFDTPNGQGNVVGIYGNAHIIEHTNVF